MSTAVALCIYDLSYGFARTLSASLLGTQLQGIWHTSVVVYGAEYYYGSFGISCSPVNQTILGVPIRTVEMGETEIPQDLFEQYLVEVSEGEFDGYRYHLMKHNCNTFSNAVVQFLTGNSIPREILELPEQVLHTPIGRMISPYIDQLMSRMNGGRRIGTQIPEHQDTSHNSQPNANPSGSSSPGVKEDKMEELD